MKKIITTTIIAFNIAFGYAQSQKDFSVINGVNIEAYSSDTKLPILVNIDDKQKITAEKFSTWMNTHFINDKRVTFSTLKIEKDQIGKTHHRLQELYNGYKIVNSMIMTHGIDKQVSSFSGEWYRDFNFTNNIAISEKQALAFALKKINAKKYKWENKAEEAQMKAALKNPKFTYQPIGEINVLPIIDAKTKKVTYAYVYKFNIYAEEPLYRANVYIDASTGAILKEENLICHTDAVGTANTKYSGSQPMTTDNVSGSFRLREVARGGGISTYNLNNSTSYSNTDFTSSTNWTGSGVDQAAADAHWGAEKTYDYFFSTYNRNSIDGAGYPLVSYMHYSNNYVNAFWNGSVMTYGDGNGSSFGIMTALDVCGHEITHGLVSNTAGLNGAEATALNEAFADIFGTVIEKYARPSQNDWLMGADIMTSGSGLRNMANPNSKGDPDTYHGTYWDYSNEPHRNAGPCDYWFYLLSAGGSGTNDNSQSYAITGITMTSAAAIAYRALNLYMTPGTTYADVRNFTIQAATDLFGACSNEVKQTTNAWYAVGVGPQTICASFPLDASITNIISPTSNVIYCVGSITPTVVLTNAGTTVLTSAKIQYKMDATATQTLNWTGSLASGASATLALNNYSGLISGAHTFTAWVALPNGGADQLASNDLLTSSFTIGLYMPLPFTEDFESSTFPPTNWSLYDAKITNTSIVWARTLNSTGIPVTPLSTACANINSYFGTAYDLGQLNGLVSPGLDFSTANSNTNLYFDVSHQAYDNTYIDSLFVYITTDCGSTWTKIYAKGDPLSLPTVSGFNTASYVPTANSQWRRDSIALGAYAGNPNVYLRFVLKNGSGNQLYLDNINIKSSSLATLDASLLSIKNPVNGSSICNNAVTPTIVLRNAGLTTLTSATILYKMDATATQTLNWTGSLTSNASATLSLNAYTGLTTAAHTFSVWVTNPNGGTDAVNSNDSQTSSFNVISVSAQALPFTEDFESSTFPPTNWSLYNANITNTSLVWSRMLNSTGIPVTPLSTACANINSFSGTANDLGQLNGLVSPGLDFSSATSNTNLYFDVSHQAYDNTYIDSLFVYITTNCGSTWTNIYAKGDPLSLPTVSGFNTSSYVPTANAQWRRDSISLGAYAGSPNVSLRFVLKNGSGNQLYLDNINVKSIVASSSVPVASVASVPSVCEGSPVTLNGAGTNSPTSWNWTIPGGSPSSSTSQNPSISFATAGTYTVTLIATNTIGASAPVTQTIIVSPIPLLTATSATICAGGTGTITANGANTYTWNSSSTGASYTAAPTSNTPYTVGGTSSFGCTSYATGYIIVATAPVITVNSANICAGGSAQLTANGVNTFTWSNNSNGASISVSPTITTVYSVTGNLNGCAAVSAAQTATVKVNPLPTVSLAPLAPLCVNQLTVSLVGSPVNGTYTGTGVLNNSVFDPATSGVGVFPINYTYTDINGCSNNATQTATVSSCTGILELNLTLISLYPNPTNNVCYIDFNNALLTNTRIELFDITGKLVHQQTVINEREVVSFVELAPGVYLLRIVSNGVYITRRVIKE